jgi:hypothetical protein
MFVRTYFFLVGVAEISKPQAGLVEYEKLLFGGLKCRK